VWNNFNYGKIDVGVNEDAVEKNSPVELSVNVGDIINAKAKSQTYGDYYRIWNTSGTYNSNWQKKQNGIKLEEYNTQSINVPVLEGDDYAVYVANLRKVVNVTFKNKFVGFPNFNGQIIVNNGAPENAPTAVYKVVEQNTITATAIYEYEFNENVGIKYTFDSWRDNSGANVGSSLTLTAAPNGNKTYTARMKGIPMFSNSNYRGLHSNYSPRNIGNPVKLTWNEHPNSHVTQYKIYRKVYGGKGFIEQEKLVATVNRGTTSWIDWGFFVGRSTTNITLYYDVRAYYSIEGTESSLEYINLKGDYPFKALTGKDTDNPGITEFAIDNFPNPFNPTTIVNYQLPYSGMVQIKVFDMLGKEVASLVNNIKDAGIYNVRFDGSSLASGTYLVHIQVNPSDATKAVYIETKKMILLK